MKGVAKATKSKPYLCGEFSNTLIVSISMLSVLLLVKDSSELEDAMFSIVSRGGIDMCRRNVVACLSKLFRQERIIKRKKSVVERKSRYEAELVPSHALRVSEQIESL